MDFKLAILGAILIAMCVVPVILIIRSSKKTEKYLLKSLKRIAKQNNCHINLHEICGEVIIGIDEEKNCVFFYQKTDDNFKEQILDLADFQSCKVVKTKKNIKRGSGNINEIEKLELYFEPISNETKNASFEFYNMNSANQLTDELQIIEKWSDFINTKLKK